MSEITIPLHGTTREGQEFDFVLDDSFLDAFSRDILEGVDCKAHLRARHKGGWIEIECQVAGKARVLCDRCMDDLLLPVDVNETLTVRFDDSPEDVVNDDDNVIVLREGTSELDMSQLLYDLICVSLPMQRVHPEGECNPQAVARLSKEEDMAAEPVNTPFSGLKELINSRKK